MKCYSAVWTGGGESITCGSLYTQLTIIIFKEYTRNFKSISDNLLNFPRFYFYYFYELAYSSATITGATKVTQKSLGWGTNH